MAEDFSRHRQYAYTENSNLVLQADSDGRRRRNNEPTGEVESLRGKLGGTRMGDRVQHNAVPAERVEKMRQRKRGRDDEGGDDRAKRAASGSGGSGGITLGAAPVPATCSRRPKRWTLVRTAPRPRTAARPTTAS